MYDLFGFVVVALVIILPITITLIALCFHGKRRGSDRPGYISLFKFFGGVGH